MKTAKNLLIFASVLFGFYSVLSFNLIASKEDFIHAVVADKPEYILPCLFAAAAFLLTGIALLSARSQSRPEDGDKAATPMFAISSIAMAATMFVSGIIFGAEDCEDGVMSFYFMLSLASSIMMVIGSITLSISMRRYWVMKMLAVVSSVAFLIYHVRMPLVWDYIDRGNYWGAYQFFDGEGASLFDIISVIAIIGNLIWLAFLIIGAARYHKLSNAYDNYGFWSRQHGATDPVNPAEQQGVVPQEAGIVYEQTPKAPCQNDANLCDAVGLMADKSRKVLKIIFGAVAALVGLSALGLITQISFYYYISEFNANELFDVYIDYTEIYNIAGWVINGLSFLLIGGGFCLLALWCKGSKSVDMWSKVLSITAFLTVALLVLQFFGLTHNQNYNVWTRTVYIVDLSCCGYLLFNIVNLIAFVNLLRRAQGKTSLKTFAILYTASMILCYSTLVLSVLDMVLSLKLDLTFINETFSLIYIGINLCASLCWAIFYGMFANVFSQQTKRPIMCGNEQKDRCEGTSVTNVIRGGE